MDFQRTTRWVRALFDLSLVVGPALVLLSAIAFVLEGEGDNDGEIAGTIQSWGFIVLSLAVIRLTGHLARWNPTGAAVVLALGMVGVAGGVSYGIDAIQADVFNTGSIQDTSSSAAPIALQLPGILFPLSFLGLGVMLIQTRAAPIPAGALLAAGAVLFPLGNIPDIQPLTIAANAVLTLAGLLLALALNREAAHRIPVVSASEHSMAAAEQSA